MFFGKKPEKSRGIGGILSLFGGILIVAGFFMPLLQPITPKDFPPATQKSLGMVSDQPSEAELSAPQRISLFKVAQNKPILYSIPAAGVLAILIGSYLFKLAILNVAVGAGCLYFLFLYGPITILGTGILFKKPGPGLGCLLAGAAFAIVGGFMTTKKNFGGDKKKKEKEKKKEKKKK